LLLGKRGGRSRLLLGKRGGRLRAHLGKRGDRFRIGLVQQFREVIAHSPSIGDFLPRHYQFMLYLGQGFAMLLQFSV
jgi:hypothetical protein